MQAFGPFRARVGPPRYTKGAEGNTLEVASQQLLKRYADMPEEAHELSKECRKLFANAFLRVPVPDLPYCPPTTCSRITKARRP